MPIRPILSAMMRNKTGAILVGLQIAITLAVVANAVFIIMQRVDKMGRPTGIDSDNVFFVQSYGYGPNYDHASTVRRDLDLIRALPGVVAAASTSGIPMSGGGSATDYSASPDAGDSEDVNANFYEVDEHAIAAYGVQLVAGRAFTEAEIKRGGQSSGSEFGPAVIVTRAFGRSLFGEQSALGKTVYDPLGRSAVVVGVIDHMLGAWVDWDQLEHVVFHPHVSDGPQARYVVRATPGMRDSLIMEVERKLSEMDIDRAITWVRPHSYFTDRSYRADKRMVAFLGVIIGLMVLITALGIVGLASFQVSLRTKQIGTRRALGARRRDIIAHFMLENWLLTTAGVVVGATLAFAFGQWLSSAYSLPRLQPVYVASGILLLWVLGLVAVFMPARRAAAIAPAIATRTV